MCQTDIVPESLREFFVRNPKVAVAFSSGTDSSYLLYAAVNSGADAVAVFVSTPFQFPGEREDAERIAKGISFLIFAQGRRQPVFERKGWSSIGAKLAEKAGVPVMPIAVKTDIQPTRPNGKGWFKDFGTVDPSKDIRLRCGPVLKGSSREMHAASFDWIKAQLD